MSDTLFVGQFLVWNGRRLQVTQIDDSRGVAVLIGARYGGSRHADLDDIKAAIAAGEILLEAPPVDVSAVLVRLNDAGGAARNDIERRRAYVAEVLVRGSGGNRNIIAQAIEHVAKRDSDPTPPSVTSVFLWADRFVRAGRDIAALVPRYGGSGNRLPRFSDELIELFWQTMDQYYLQRACPSARQAHEWLGDALVDVNKGRKVGRLKMPSYEVFCKWIRSLVDPYWRVVRREGARAAIKQFRGMGDGIVSTYPLERVEIDHTIVDVVVEHPITGEVIGRPTLTWAMDHYSRVILGIYLSLQPPSSMLVLSCLKQVMQDKSAQLQDIPGFVGFFWDQHGVPATIVVDNGAEFHGEHFKHACAAYGVSIQYCPPGRPWFKGRAERFIGTLNKGLLHQLPGTTRSNPKDRGTYPSEQLASLTLAELQTLIVRWIVADYHERHHRTLGTSPKAAWQAGLAEHPTVTVADPKTLDLGLAMSVEATISGSRLQFKTLRYSSPALASLGMKLGKGHRKVKVLYIPDDISTAYVCDPHTNSVFEVPCVTHGVAQGMSLDAYSLIRKVKRHADEATKPIGSINEAVKAIRQDVHAMHQEAEVKFRREKREAKSGKSARPKSTGSKAAAAATHGLNKKEQHRLENQLSNSAEQSLSTAESDIASDRARSKFSFHDDACDVVSLKRRAS